MVGEGFRKIYGMSRPGVGQFLAAEPSPTRSGISRGTGPDAA
jgi:hypothetical protein